MLLPNAALLHVAQAKGYFAKQGLQVAIQVHPFGKPALTALLEKRADLATCTQTPVVFAALKGQRVSILATISESTRATALIARADAGIAGPKDLGGRRIGVTSGSSGEFFLDTLLLRHRVERSTVRIVNLPPDELADAIANGELDAVVLWNPLLGATEKRLGGLARAFYVDDLYLETFDLVSRPDFVESHPLTIQRLLRGLVEADDLFARAPAEAKSAALAEIGRGAPESLAGFDQFDFRIQLYESLLALMDEEARWAIRGRLANRPATFNLLTAIDPGPLLEAKPDAVQILR